MAPASSKANQFVIKAITNAGAPTGMPYTVVQLCNCAQLLGYGRGVAVKFCGGDGNKKAPVTPAYATTYHATPVQRNTKYCAGTAFTALGAYAMANNPAVTKAMVSKAIAIAQATTLNINAKGSNITLQQGLAMVKNANKQGNTQGNPQGNPQGNTQGNA